MLVFWLLFSNLANRLRTPPDGGTVVMVSAGRTGCFAGIDKGENPSRRLACVRVGEINQRGDLATVVTREAIVKLNEEKIRGRGRQGRESRCSNVTARD